MKKLKKYQNVGRPVGFIVNGRTLDFANGEVVQVDDNFKDDVNESLSKLVEVNDKKSSPVIKPVVETPVSVPVLPAPQTLPHAGDAGLERFLRDKAKELGSFGKFRDFAKENYRVTGRSVDGIIEDILAGKVEL